MKNKELFTLNPEQVNLKNEGVTKIKAMNEDENLDIVEYELKTFVCEGEYHDGLKKMLDTYLQNLNSPEQPAFWVSGFYGSGKSHLVKMTGYLWENFEFPDGKTARDIKPLPQEIKDLFVEIDRKQKIQGKLSIAGTLRDFPSKDIRYSFLQLLLNALGLPQQYHHFKFVNWIKKESKYDELKALVESSGRNFKKEIENLFVSTVLSKSVLELFPDMAENESKLKEIFKLQFPRVEKIGREDFINTILDDILPFKFGDKIPCTIIILDEIQQFIGQDSNIAFDVQLLAEDLCSRFDGKFLLVGTGQNALTDTPNLQKLMARFRIPIQLSNTDIQTVIRKTILDKKPSMIPMLNNKMEENSGEISRILEGTKFGYITEDKITLTADYPLLPSTRKFWYKVLQVIDVAGTSGQLRNQLRLVDDSLKTIAGKEVGEIVSADFIFNQNQTQLIQGGLLLNDTSSMIQEKKSKGGDSEIEGRILSAVFLLDRIISNDPDTGLKSNETTIADLLINNLNVNSDSFRNKVKELIKKLVEEKVLMPINEEYKLQTKIGAEWEQEFTRQYIKINNSGEDQILNLRKEKILNLFKEKTKTINITHGNSKITRQFELWEKDTKPNTEHKLNLWIRDGWLENDSIVENEVRSAGNNTPIAYAYVKKQRDTELRPEIIKYIAAGLTMNAMGVPSTPEGEQAKKSMETRQTLAKNAIQELIEKICNETKVYLAGGTEVKSGTLKDNIQEAFYNIADRQFPEFKRKADFSEWGKALNKALVGNPDALSAINYSGDIHDHPVALEILRFLGNTSKTGKEIRNHFMKSPYGWCQDSIDTILILLKNLQFISSSETDLKVAKINQSVFKKEVHTLTITEKMNIKSLFQKVGIQCPPNQDLFPYSNKFIEKLKSLALKAGGDAPLPEPINTDFLMDIENKEGNERLLEILNQKEDLLLKYQEWSKIFEIISLREPQWKTINDLYNHISDTPEMEELKSNISAIKENRLLLNEPDVIQPALTELTEKLLDLLNKRKEKYNEIYDSKMAELLSNKYFVKITSEQKNKILAKNLILSKPEIKVLDSNALLNQLNKTSLINWDTKIAALPEQFQLALEDAVLLSSPDAITYSLPRRTLSNQNEIEKYILEIKRELENLIKGGNSIILK